MWSASSRDLYHFILEQANSSAYINGIYHKNYMLKQDRPLADHAAILSTVCNGEQHSGMAAIMRYAQKMGRINIVIAPSPSLSPHGDTVLVSVYSCERSSAPYFLSGCAVTSGRKERKSHTVSVFR